MDGGNVAFTDAVARARQIAAKLGTASATSTPTGNGAGFNSNPLTGGLSDKGNPNSMPLGVKRSFPGGGEDEINAKKPSHEPDAITAQLRALADQQRSTSAKDMAKMAAEQVAAKLNQSIGMSAGNPSVGSGGPHAGLGLVQSEEWSIPNKVVGLVIGSKGENITQIQAQSGCRIQIAPDPPPGQIIQDRHVSLNGTAESIAKAKDLVNKTIQDAGQCLGMPGGMGGDMGGQTLEMMIPANKVGLVIGKGGETIKQLQAKSGCKMMMIQDGQYQNAAEKPLRITGEPSMIENAKIVVKELIDSKDIQGRHPAGDYNNYGGGGGQAESIPVPREAVGIIIGKGGDMIKTIQGKFNVKIQFQNDSGGPQRMCDISGNPSDVFAAKQHVQQLIADNQNRGMGGMNRAGAGRPGNGGFGQRGFGQDQTTMTVPSERCGIVIGKGGENIRTICEMSGAHVELNRNAPPGPDKEFTIKGTPDQIQHAMHLINEKINVPPRGPGGGAPGGWGGPPQGAPYGGGPGNWNGPPGTPQGGPPGGGYGGPPQQQQAGWGNYNYNQWGQQGQQQQSQQQPGAPGTAADQQQQSQDQAWQAYYAQYYGQYQQQAQGAAGQQQGAATAQAISSAPTSQASQPAAQTTAATTAQPKINPTTGEPDYTEQWAAYYRQMGWHEQADAILKQSQNGQQQSQ